MPKKYIILGAIAFLTVLGFEIYVLFLASNKKNAVSTDNSSVVSQKASPDIFLLSDPVNRFVGKIEKIEDNTLFVSKSVTPQQVPPQSAADSIPTQVSKTFKLTITNDTAITKIIAVIPYVFKSTDPLKDRTSKTTRSALKIGQFITATTAIDLRTLQSDTFEVIAIDITTPDTYPIGGVIAEISETTIKISGHTLNQQGAQTEIKVEEFDVMISQDTEIATPPIPGSPPAKKLSISDLQVGQNVSVFSDTAFLPNQNTTALLIVLYHP